MKYETIYKEIISKYSIEDYYRFDMKLPKHILGRGRKHEMYVPPCEAKPWVNGDCKIPIQYLQGAVVKEIIADRAIISFIMGTKDLLPFLKEMDGVINFENDAELVELDSGTVGD